MLKGSGIMKLLGLITGVAFLNIIVFSPGLLGVELGGGSALGTASGVTLLVVSLLVLLYGSYNLLFKPRDVKPLTELSTYEDYRSALNDFKSIHAVKKDIEFAVDQIEQIEKKKRALLNVLGQRFEQTELSYRKFNGVIIEVNQLFYLNIRGILNKLQVFDASGLSSYAGQPSPKQNSNKRMQEKTDLYNEILANVAGALGANEEILLKLDKLLLEISQLGTIDYKDIEEMACMKEMDTLIKQTKFYKQ